jgi:hypothetical protein
MKRKHQKMLELIFKHPVSANVQWKDVLSFLEVLGATVEERAGSRAYRVEWKGNDSTSPTPFTING